MPTVPQTKTDRDFPKFKCDIQNNVLPVEIMNEIMCYLIDNTNYIHLMLLSKCTYNYFIQYFRPLLMKSCAQQYTLEMDPPATITVKHKWSKNIINKNVNRKIYTVGNNYQQVNIIGVLFKYDKNYKHDISDIILYIVYDKVIEGVDTNIVDWFIGDMWNAVCHDYDGYFKTEKELLDFINYHTGQQLPPITDDNIDDIHISQEDYVKIRDVIINKYEEDHKGVKIYVYYEDGIFDSPTIELVLASLDNMINLSIILNIRLKKMNNPDEYSCGYLRYVGHISILDKKYPVYGVGYDH